MTPNTAKRTLALLVLAVAALAIAMHAIPPPLVWSEKPPVAREEVAPVLPSETTSPQTGIPQESGDPAVFPRQDLPTVSLQRGDDFLSGIALGLYYRESWRDYEEPLEEISALHANTVSLVVTWSQDSWTATEIHPDADETRDDSIVSAAIRDAHDEGLRVMVFPILKLVAREQGHWRGNIEPVDADAWFESYWQYILHYAEIAEAEGAEYFSVGSELGSMEAYEGHWREMIRRLREVYSGQLLYSANWDHYAQTPFWDAVDLIGLTAYYELTDSEEEVVSVEGLVRAWLPIQADIDARLAPHNRPYVFTEVGYYSQRGTAFHPWDYTRRAAVDLEEQYLCYAAFYQVWRDHPTLGGVFFWHWWGDGGPEDDSYNPRGKPAAEIIGHWFGQY